MTSAAGSGFVSTARIAGASFFRDKCVPSSRSYEVQKAVQVFLVEDDGVVEEIAACGAYEPLSDSVLPGTARRDLLWLDAHVADRGKDVVAVLGVTVEDQGARCLVVGERLAVVAEESPPALTNRWIDWMPGHEAGDGALGDDEAVFLDLAVNAWRAPRRILGRHPVVESADLGRCALASSVAPRLPAPVPWEAFTMPAHDGAG